MRITTAVTYKMNKVLANGIKYLKMIRYITLFPIIMTSCRHHPTCEELESNYFALTDNLKTKSDSIDFLAKIDLILKKEPTCLKAYHIKGHYAIRNGNLKESKLIFLKSLQYNNSSVYSLYNLACLYNIDGINDTAYKFINLAIQSKQKAGAPIDYNNFFAKEFDIEFSELLFFRGVIFMEEEYFVNAIKDFQIVEKRKYNLTETYAYLAKSYYGLNKRDSSCLYLNKYKDLNGEIPNSFNKGILNACIQ